MTGAGQVSDSRLLLLVVALHSCGSVGEHLYELDALTGSCVDAAHVWRAAPAGRAAAVACADTAFARLRELRPPPDLFKMEWAWTNFAVLRGESLRVLNNAALPIDIVHDGNAGAN